MSVTFVKGAVTVTLRNPNKSNVLGVKLHQAIGRAAGGSVYVYNKGVTVRQMRLSFVEITTAIKATLDSFFVTTVVGAQETFTYTDHDSNAWTARFIEDELTWSEDENGYWSIEITLEVEAVP